jgi:hypothetical protein
MDWYPDFAQEMNGIPDIEFRSREMNPNSSHLASNVDYSGADITPDYSVVTVQSSDLQNVADVINERMNDIGTIINKMKKGKSIGGKAQIEAAAEVGNWREKFKEYQNDADKLIAFVRDCFGDIS